MGKMTFDPISPSILNKEIEMAKYKDAELVELDLDFGGIAFCNVKIPKGFDTKEYLDQITREITDKMEAILSEIPLVVRQEKVVMRKPVTLKKSEKMEALEE